MASLSTRAGLLRAALPALALAALVTLATAVGYNLRHVVAVAADDDLRMVFYEFHGVERAEDGFFRWTNGQSRICLEQLGRVPASSMTLRVLGEGANALGNNTLRLMINGRPIVDAAVPGSTRRYQLLLGDALASSDDTCVTLASAAVSSRGDPRPLGLPFAQLKIYPLAEGGPVRPAALQLGLNLALAGLLLWLLRRLGLAPWPAAAAVSLGVGLVLLDLASGLVTSGVGLARVMAPLVAGLALLAAGWEGARALRLRGRWGTPLGRDLLAMAFWSLALCSITRLLQAVLGYSGVWPLKAGFFPAFSPFIAVPLALFAGWLWLILRGLGDDRAAARQALWLLPLGAVALPVALKAGARGVESLFFIFATSPFEYIADVPRVADQPLTFLRSYVEIAPTLALHSSTHPPGSILLLWAVGHLLGPGPVAASWAAIVLSAGGPMAAMWLGWRLGGPRAGLLAGALAAVMPGHQVYSVTSMDGVFNGILALGAVAFLLALEPGARPRAAALAGGLIALGLFFTYAATQLVFFGLGALGMALWRDRESRWAALAPPLRQGLIAAGTLAAAYLLIFLATGYNVAAGAVRATAINSAVMRGVEARPFLPPNFAFYVLFLSANLLPFAWYLGPWGLTAAIGAGRQALAARPPAAAASLAAAIATLVAGLWLGGLFNREVERIWAFAFPLIAALSAAYIWQGDPRERRWRAGLYITLFFLHAVAIRVLLNTYW